MVAVAVAVAVGVLATVGARPLHGVVVGDVGGDAPAVASGDGPVRSPSSSSLLQAPGAVRVRTPAKGQGAKGPTPARGAGVGASVNQVLTRVLLLQVGVDDEEGHHQAHQLSAQRRSAWWDGAERSVA